MRLAAIVIALGLPALSCFALAGAKPHHVMIQVDQNDPDVMNLALNNASNVIDYYRNKGEDVEVEVVAYGPGLNMLRDDASPVKDRIKQLTELAFPSSITFSACNVTKQGIEKRGGACHHTRPAGHAGTFWSRPAHGVTGTRLELRQAVAAFHGAGSAVPTRFDPRRCWSQSLLGDSPGRRCRADFQAFQTRTTSPQSSASPGIAVQER